MLFHPEAEKAFNTIAYHLVSLMEVGDINKSTSNPSIGSVAERTKHDWSDKLIGGMIVSSTDIMGKRLDLYYEADDKKIGFNKVNYLELENFLKKVFKVKSVSQKISYKFLFEISFKWLLNIKKGGQSSSDYCLYLESQIEDVAKDHKYRFEILNLDIEKKFKIGDVMFEFLTSDFFDTIEVKEEKDREGLREMYKGHVYATYEMTNVEEGRGEEIAYIECCKAMDVLKMFSPTVTLPEYRTDYDIDKRVRSNLKSEVITGRIDEKGISMSIRMEVQAQDFTIDTIDNILKTCKNFETLIKIEDPNELQKLILNSLSLFSEAISNRNIHKRIVDLLTIWESLLLKDSNTPIASSVSTYASKFLRKTVEERRDFISFFKEIYDIRSNVIHHAINVDLDMHKVAQFQRETVNLMEILIHHSKKHANKQSLLKEIDDAMHGAG